MREASERVLASMLAVFNGCAPDQTKHELVDRLRREEVEPGPDVRMDFLAHGMGLVSHEAPRLTNHKGTYEGYDATRPLEADMVISIETTMANPKRGFIKLEVAWASAIRGGAGIGRDNDSQGC